MNMFAFGIIALILTVIVGVYMGNELNEKAEAFCLSEGLEFHHRITYDSKIACYKTTGDSVEIIVFEVLEGKMYRVTES